MNNIDISKMLEALSKMDKNELEAGIAKANQFFKSTDKKDILNEFKKNNGKYN